MKAGYAFILHTPKGWPQGKQYPDAKREASQKPFCLQFHKKKQGGEV